MAFQSANSSVSGKLLAEELTEKLKQRNAAITAESVADLMNRYMTKECPLVGDRGFGMVLEFFSRPGGGVIRMVVYGNFAGSMRGKHRNSKLCQGASRGNIYDPHNLAWTSLSQAIKHEAHMFGESIHSGWRVLDCHQ